MPKLGKEPLKNQEKESSRVLSLGFFYFYISLFFNVAYNVKNENVGCTHEDVNPLKKDEHKKDGRTVYTCAHGKGKEKEGVPKGLGERNRYDALYAILSGLISFTGRVP